MNAAPSRAHWNVEPGSLEVNEKLAVLLLLCSGGPELMFVWGGMVSGGGGGGGGVGDGGGGDGGRQDEVATESSARAELLPARSTASTPIRYSEPQCSPVNRCAVARVEPANAPSR